jgi:hypothetical protein
MSATMTQSTLAYENAKLKQEAAQFAARYRELETRYNALYAESNNEWRELKSKLDAELEWVKWLIRDAAKAKLIKQELAENICRRLREHLGGNYERTTESLVHVSLPLILRGVTSVLSEAVGLARREAPQFEPVLQGLLESIPKRDERYWVSVMGWMYL